MKNHKTDMKTKLAWALLAMSTFATVLCTVSAYAEGGIKGIVALIITLVCVCIETYALSRIDN